ncbi:hypothetical protein [Achromobacter ruhlandii]|nr:hypothetical protein LMG26684_03215 [Achromobacter mucicolens]
MTHPSPSERMTNVECVADLMEYSSFGPLAQMFVVDALLKHATTVSQLSDEALEEWPENPLFHPHSWRGVAKEIRAKLERHLDHPASS